MRVLSLRISGLPLGSLGTKCHLDVAPVERCRVYYKGEGGGFPQVQVVVSLVNPNCPWLILAPKVLQLCANHLVLVLCRSVWVIKACHFFLVPSRSSSTALYPSKVLRAKELAPTSCSSVVFCLGYTFRSLKELGACHFLSNSLVEEAHFLLAMWWDGEPHPQNAQLGGVNERSNGDRVIFKHYKYVGLIQDNIIIKMVMW